MGRFASTVAYYESARPPYGAAFFAAVAGSSASIEASACSMSAPGRAFWRSASPPIAARSSASIRSPHGRGARAAAERTGVAVRFIEGRFEDVAAKLGAFDVVTIGRAIHWLDPEPARAALDRAIAPRGRDSGVRRYERQRRAQPRGSKPSTRCAIAGRASGRRATIIRFSPTASSSRPDDPRPGDLRRSRRAPGRPRAVDVDLLVGAARRPSPRMKSAMREPLAPFAADGMIEDNVEARAEVFERA